MNGRYVLYVKSIKGSYVLLVELTDDGKINDGIDCHVSDIVFNEKHQVFEVRLQVN